MSKSIKYNLPANHWQKLLPGMTRIILATVGLTLTIGCRTVGPTFAPRPGPSRAVIADFKTTEPEHIKPEWLKPPTEPFRLGPGDKIEIEILGISGTRTMTFVCPDGKIYYDLLPGIDVWGLSIQETKATMERELGAFYKRPQVVVNLRSVESKRVWVLGRLNKSGLYPLAQPMTVIEAISRAGGLFTSRFGGTTEELADLNHSFLIRKGEMLPVNFQKLLREGDTAQNIYLQPDDFIYLPSSLSKEVCVLGAVNSPRPIGFEDNMTVVSALAKALGPQPGAQLAKVAIVRGSLASPKIAIVDVNAILTGKETDIRLEPRDIIYVPFTPYRTLEKYAKMITDTFVRTVAANEGGHAAAPSFSGVGVSNPIQ